MRCSKRFCAAASSPPPKAAGGGSLKTSEPVFLLEDSLPHSCINPEIQVISELVNQTRAQGWFSRIWLYFAVQKSFGAFGRQGEARGSVMSIPQRRFGPSEKSPRLQKNTSTSCLLCHFCFLSIFIKIKTQRSLRHSCVPTDVNSLRSLSGGLSSVPRTKADICCYNRCGLCPKIQLATELRLMGRDS